MVQEHRDIRIKHNSKLNEVKQQIEQYKKFLEDCEKTNTCNENIYKTIQERLNILISFQF